MQVTRKNFCYFMFLIGMCSTMVPVVAATNGGTSNVINNRLFGVIYYTGMIIFTVLSITTFVMIANRRRFTYNSPEYNKYNKMFIIFGILTLISLAITVILYIILDIISGYFNVKFLKKK